MTNELGRGMSAATDYVESKGNGDSRCHRLNNRDVLALLAPAAA